LASHWLFQSLLYMDMTERRFKLGLDIALALLGTVILVAWLPLPAAAMLALVVAHTLNFLLNGHLWGVLKHYGMVHNTQAAFQEYVDRFWMRVEREPSIEHGFICGSISREQWSPSSDLDVRLIRRPGFLNGLRACWFVLLERSRAFRARFPIDIYVLDRAS